MPFIGLIKLTTGFLVSETLNSSKLVLKFPSESLVLMPQEYLPTPILYKSAISPDVKLLFQIATSSIVPLNDPAPFVVSQIRFNPPILVPSAYPDGISKVELVFELFLRTPSTYKYILSLSPS